MKEHKESFYQVEESAFDFYFSQSFFFFFKSKMGVKFFFKCFFGTTDHVIFFSISLLIWWIILVDFQILN